MSEILTRMLVSYKLVTSTSETPGPRGRRSKRFSAAERQNWHCAYCGVKMYAGHPAEDICAYAAEMKIRIRRAGIWWPPAFEQILQLKATTEHLIGQSYRDAIGPYINSRHNLISSCLWCNSHRAILWDNKDEMGWYEEVQRLIEAKRHPHYLLISQRAK